MKRKISDYLGPGTSIGFCAALGIALGALLQNPILWLMIGAGLGVVLGAIIQMYKQKNI